MYPAQGPPPPLLRIVTVLSATAACEADQSFGSSHLVTHPGRFPYRPPTQWQRRLQSSISMTFGHTKEQQTMAINPLALSE